MWSMELQLLPSCYQIATKGLQGLRKIPEFADGETPNARSRHLPAKAPWRTPTEHRLVHRMELVTVLDLLCLCYSFYTDINIILLQFSRKILTVLNLCLTDEKLVKINASLPHCTYTEHQRWTCEKKKGRALSSSSCSNEIRDLTRILTFRCGYSSIKTLCWHPLGLGHPGQIY